VTAFDRVYGGVPRFAAEAPWSARLARRLLAGLAAETETDRFGSAARVQDAAGRAPVVFVCADPEALVPPGSQRRLVEGLAESGFDLLAAVSNESEEEALRCAPGFSYFTASDLEEAAAGIAAAAGGFRASRCSRSPVYAVRRSVLASLPSDLPLREVADAFSRGGHSTGFDSGAYVHRYGPMDASERTDLAEKIPRGARRVLDVGCSRGASAPAIRRRGVEEIYGIEPDAEDAAEAARRYDRVIASKLEDVREPWSGLFDAVLFGDVLEHLADPARALVAVRPWIAAGGRVIASVPNWGNASIIADLLRGRLDYVPYSTISGTHVRFFTRQTAADLFEACGYTVEEISGAEAVFAPSVVELRDRLRRVEGASPDLDVVELLVVAHPRSGGYHPST